MRSVNLVGHFTPAAEAGVAVDNQQVHQYFNQAVQVAQVAVEKAVKEEGIILTQKTEPMALQIQVEAPAVAVLLVVIVATLAQVVQEVLVLS